jgi:hypothetical protein
MGSEVGTTALKEMRLCKGYKIEFMALYGMTAAQWREQNPNKDGNIRDESDVSQLVCLANLETLNAMLINDGLQQNERLIKLNSIAIEQMKILT